MSDPQKLIEEASKAANQKGGWFSGNKTEEAVELYGQAANAFKLQKQWKESADAFMQQAQLLVRSGEKDEAATSYMNASKSYKKINPRESISSLQLATDILSEKGRFSAAANNQKQIAEMWETDVQDVEKALKAYEIASDWYIAEESVAHANGCILKVASLAATLEQYDKAIEKFESVANASIDNNLTKWSVRDYLFKSAICILCLQDYVRAQNALERYCNLDVSFSTTREFKLIQDLLGACQDHDVEAFTNSLVDFDRLSKLDSWKTTLLLRVKKTLGEDVDFT